MPKKWIDGDDEYRDTHRSFGRAHFIFSFLLARQFTWVIIVVMHAVEKIFLLRPWPLHFSSLSWRQNVQFVINRKLESFFSATPHATGMTTISQFPTFSKDGRSITQKIVCVFLQCNNLSSWNSNNDDDNGFVCRRRFVSLRRRNHENGTRKNFPCSFVHILHHQRRRR